MSYPSMPPNVKANDKIILYDGVCKLCNAWSNFIIKHDTQHLFKLCSVQSEAGQKILRHYGFPTEHFETMLYVERGAIFQQSDAFFQVMKTLGFPWKVATIFLIIPKPVRNWLYDRIAFNRYFLFGKYDVCMLPTADHKSRFLN